jgi:hypothetical protein
MKSVNPHTFTSLIAGILLITGCATQPEITVSTDYSAANFDEFKTFQWLPEGLESKGEKAENDIAHQHIVSSINKTLIEKGYQQKEASTPDFYVNYSVSRAEKIDIDKEQVYEGYAPGFTWRRGYGAQATDSKVELTETHVIEYLEGTLVVDIIDPENLHIIWRGIGTKKLPEYFDHEIAERVITNVVTATLENYPPPTEQ